MLEIIINQTKNMGFWSSKSKVTKEEFRKVRSALRSQGLSDYDLNDIEKVFRGDLAEADRGIDAQEIKKGIAWLKKNKSKHHLSSDQINKLSQELKKRL